MKIFYREINDPQRILDSNATSIEELSLPDNAKDEFYHALRESTESLPVPARKFQDWNVGLLDECDTDS